MVRVIFVGVTLLVLPVTSFAQVGETRWINPSGGLFDSAVNWDAGIPGPDTDALFELDAFYDVELEEDASVRSFQQSNGQIIWFGGKTLSIANESGVRAGELTLRGAGTSLSYLNSFRGADSGNAIVNVEANTILSSNSASLGSSGFTGRANVDGLGALWENETEWNIGESGGLGILNLANGGRVNSAKLNLGFGEDSQGFVNVDGTLSALTTIDELSIGHGGRGEIRISNGGRMSTQSVSLGAAAGSFGSVTVTGQDSQWNAAGDGISLAENGTGAITILEGGRARLTRLSVAKGSTGRAFLAVEDSGSRLEASVLEVGQGGSVFISDGATMRTFGINNRIGIDDTVNDPNRFARVTVSGIGSRLDMPNVNIALDGNARLIIEEGAFVSGGAIIGGSAKGLVTVQSGATWDMGQTSPLIGWGNEGDAEVSVLNGTLRSLGGSIALNFGSTGIVRISGSNGSWVTTQQLSIGSRGAGTVEVSSGGLLRNRSAQLGSTDHGTATVRVDGFRSRWELESQLDIGRFGDSTVEISDSGYVRVGFDGFEGLTTIGSEGAVVIDDGHFDFGTINTESLARIRGESGILEGDILLDGYNSITALDSLKIANLDMSLVRVGNHGVIHGDGTTSLGLSNSSSGEVRTRAGEWTRFEGFNNANRGEINNFGGLIEFENDLTNLADGFIGGRGQFIANEGFTNEGVMAFSSGVTDILGDLTNVGDSQIVTSGFATTTFFDDVVHNGAEIRTAEGSATVFLGGYSGAGSFTGSGDVFFEGDLRPGNSPDVVRFAGDVFLGSGAHTLIELTGLDLGEFDKLEVDGDLHLDGELSVELLDGFELGFDQEFLIAEVNGERFGQFDNLAEGEFVGSFGAHSLFISYLRGDGNDVALFTSVPEPSSHVLLLLVGLAVTRRRTLRKLSPRKGQASIDEGERKIAE